MLTEAGEFPFPIIWCKPKKPSFENRPKGPEWEVAESILLPALDFNLMSSMNLEYPDDVKLTPVKDVVEIPVKCRHNVFSYFLLETSTIIVVIITMIIIMMMKYESDLRGNKHCLNSSKNKI